ncbi:histidine kinase N-terminal 7TM domain-containing protein [Halovenus sp. HT40]|uniref:histidine kinase N-terminal 7TM domain-containing protein n=1 Tax=Halovenus sp. HT40 TaxID=3126691 RepID=UPI00300E7FFC
MSLLFTWPVLGALVAGLGTASLVYYLSQYRDRPGARWFMLALTGQALFCLSYAVGLTVFDPAIREWIEIAGIIGLHWIGVPFLAFALEYTGRSKLVRSWWFRSLFAVPLAVTVLLPLNDWHELFWTGFTIESVYGVATVSYAFEPLFYVTVLGGTTVGGIGALVLFDTVWSYGPLYRSEALAVGLSFGPAAAGLFAWLLGVRLGGEVNVLVYALLPHIALDAYAFVGKGMFEFHPATSRAAERSAFEDLQSPVFVLDTDSRVVESNSAAADLFGVDPEAVATNHISEIVDSEIDIESTTQRLTIQSDGRRREFSVECAPLSDSDDNHVGYTLLFQEITEEVQRKERLSVLNRVLRHNLRNELTIVQGHLGIAEDRVIDEQGEQSLTIATDAVDNLLSTSETARTVERTLDSTGTDRQVVDLATIFETIKEIQAEHPAATISVETPAVRLRTNPLILRSVLRQLVENAIEHGESDPTVRITASQTDTAFEITVDDDGPGIPDHELEVIQRGEETALEHGSGLGLWLVKWGTARLGGGVTFETEEGSTITLSFPPSIVAETAEETENVVADGPQRE